MLLRSLWSGSLSIRAGAVGCVRELVAKRMPPLAKLALIQRLQLVEARALKARILPALLRWF